jgi:hypothetical protein
MAAMMSRPAGWVGTLGIVLMTLACTATPPAPTPTAAPKPAGTQAPPPTAAAAPTSAAAPTAAAAGPTGAVAGPTGAVAGPAAGAADQAIADFYRGKTLRIVVAFGPGGTYDAYSRFVAANLPKYLPGSPTVVVENKPGGGGLIAANAVYNTEPRDGTVILSITEDLPLQQIIGADGVAFEADKFQWLGASVHGSYVCGTRTGAGVSSLDDLLAGKPLVMGTISPSNAMASPPSSATCSRGTLPRSRSSSASASWRRKPRPTPPCGISRSRSRWPRRRRPDS